MKTEKRMLINMLIVVILSSPILAIGKAQAHVEEDLDPLVDVSITFELQAIRSLEKMDVKNHEIEWIDYLGEPDFYVKLFINGREFKSPIWRNTRYVYDPQWSVTCDVPDDVELVTIKIQLWDWNLGKDKLCDISGDYYDAFRGSYDVELTYSIKSGHWFDGDYTSNDPVSCDPSGYGRLCGCDDGSIYQRERDCELWFDITQNDYDGDGIPYWTEVNAFHTDPTVDNTGEDADHDGVPIEWEWKWGYFYDDWHQNNYWIYDPFVWENHAVIDVDGDSLTNVEEYLTSQWGSDPYRKDVFVELDQMEDSPDGKKCVLPEGAKELLRTAYDRQNIVYHLDDGSWENTGSETIPFEEVTPRQDLQQYYYPTYFLHGDENNWRKGVFHYGIVVYDAEFSGYCFRNNAFQISTSWIDKNIIPILLEGRDVAYASVFMHETGHTFGFYPIPGHDTNSYYPWQLGFWKSGPYRSCMNYRYTYRLVDYSDGSRGRNDYDDWERMDFSYFERSSW
jgi:hypothetical protein